MSRQGPWKVRGKYPATSDSPRLGEDSPTTPQMRFLAAPLSLKFKLLLSNTTDRGYNYALLYSLT